MQIGGPGTQEQGWTNTQVTAALERLYYTRQATENATEFLEVITQGTYFLILIAGIYLGYTISHYFLPNAKDIGAR